MNDEDAFFTSIRNLPAYTQQWNLESYYLRADEILKGARATTFIERVRQHFVSQHRLCPNQLKLMLSKNDCVGMWNGEGSSISPDE